jgi:hypothetical protein
MLGLVWLEMARVRCLDLVGSHGDEKEEWKLGYGRQGIISRLGDFVGVRDHEDHLEQFHVLGLPDELELGAAEECLVRGVGVCCREGSANYVKDESPWVLARAAFLGAPLQL